MRFCSLLGCDDAQFTLRQDLPNSCTEFTISSHTYIYKYSWQAYRFPVAEICFLSTNGTGSLNLPPDIYV